MALAYQGTDILFMAVSGVLITIAATHVVLFYNSFLFLVTSLLFTMIKFKRLTKDESQKSDTNLSVVLKNYVDELVEGLRYIKNSLIPQILIGSIIANFLIGAFVVSLPSYSQERGGVEFYGYYLVAFSAGSLIGSLLATILKNIKIGKITIIGFMFGELHGYLPGLYLILLYLLFYLV